MNLWVSMEDEGAFTSTEEAFHRSLAPLAKHIESVEGAKPSYHPYGPIHFDDQVQVLLDEGISAFSFIYGIPSKQILEEFRRRGIVLIGTATTVDEAIALEHAGVDAIVASGFEAGGHRGSFLQSSEDSLTGTMALVPQVVDAVSVPVAAAGGIGDARGIMAAFALGAEGVQMGTAFLACEESGASVLHRNALLSGQAKQTALTRGFTGRLARGIKNRLLDELNQKDIEILPYPLQRALVRHLSIPAEKTGRPELLPLWAGQSANLSRCTDVRTLLDTLVREISEIGGALQNWSAHRRSGNAQD
jgi:nitronate monooxygenase